MKIEKEMTKISMLILLAIAIFIPAVAQAALIPTITSPANKSQLEPCNTIIVSASVEETEGTEIKDMYLYAGPKSLGRIRSEPWEAEWENAPWGVYPVYAKARDNDNNSFISDTVWVTVGEPGQGSLIYNGGFDCESLWPWNEETYVGGVFNAELMNDKWFQDSTYAAIYIENAGEQKWSCQLVQSVKVDSGHTYQIFFWADAPEEKQVNVLFQNANDPYNEFFNQEIIISEYSEYGPYDFVCEETATNVRFKFTFGGDTKEFYIDQVTVVDLDAPAVSVQDRAANTVPENFTLQQNYPNPFNMETTIAYNLPSNAQVELTIHNINGQLVQAYQLGSQSAGSHTLHWNGSDLNGNIVPSGVYFYRLHTTAQSSTITQSKKMIVIK